MSIEKYNKQGNNYTFKANFDTYYKLKDLVDYIDKPKKILQLRGMYTHTGKYGLNATLITDQFYVNLPAHMTQQIVEMMADDEVTKQINEGKAGFTIYSYENQSGGTSYSVNFVTVNTLNVTQEELPF